MKMIKQVVMLAVSLFAVSALANPVDELIAQTKAGKVGVEATYGTALGTAHNGSSMKLAGVVDLPNERGWGAEAYVAKHDYSYTVMGLGKIDYSITSIGGYATYHWNKVTANNDFKVKFGLSKESGDAADVGVGLLNVGAQLDYHLDSGNKFTVSYEMHGPNSGQFGLGYRYEFNK